MMTPGVGRGSVIVHIIVSFLSHTESLRLAEPEWRIQKFCYAKSFFLSFQFSFFSEWWFIFRSLYLSSFFFLSFRKAELPLWALTVAYIPRPPFTYPSASFELCVFSARSTKLSTCLLFFQRSIFYLINYIISHINQKAISSENTWKNRSKTINCDQENWWSVYS